MSILNLFRTRRQKPLPSIAELTRAFGVMGATCWLKTPEGDGNYYPCGHGTAAKFLYSILRGSPLMEGYGVSWTTSEE